MRSSGGMTLELSDSNAPLQSRYSLITVPLQSHYSPVTVPLQFRYSALQSNDNIIIDKQSSKWHKIHVIILIIAVPLQSLQSLFDTFSQILMI